MSRSISPDVAGIEEEAAELLASHRSYVEQELAQADREVRLIPYNGFPSDSVGRNGDLVLDQLNNTIYGPKQNGIWPLEGFKVEGPVLSARNRIRLNQIREENSSENTNNGAASFWKAIFRFLLTGRLRPAYVYSAHFKP